MKVVWEPDDRKGYRSSGCDNLALQEVAEGFARIAEDGQLDPLGCIVESMERACALEREFVGRAVTNIHRCKIPRDASSSFYCADPNGLVMQMLYEPQLSLQTIKA